jgi:two-component system CheB/CheR fusion protein
MAAKSKGADESGLETAGEEPPVDASGRPSGADDRTVGSPAERATKPRFRMVGIGASAGGLEALTELFQAMQAGTGMAFAVVSHLDPEHKSALGEILSRVSSVPVHEVEDGMAVEPDHVYVIPPNRDMNLIRGVLQLTPRVESHVPQMPIDTFLRSLARDNGSYAVGVILSGTGTDGTLGLKAIKGVGGLTFAQDNTARYVGMPRSAIAAGAVDSVLPPAQIAAELVRISRYPPTPTEEAASEGGPAEKDAFLEILKLLSESSGVDFVQYKHSTLLRRIERRMVLRRFQCMADYLGFLRQDLAERHLLFEEVLIPVTSFFREPDLYVALKSTILPRLMADRPSKAPLRIWVPGCSTGEEAYSLAICLLEFLGTAAETIPMKIFATDISERAVELARAGAYGEAISAEVSPQRLQRFFLKTDRGYEISKTVRDLCVFARQDLTRDPPFSQLDLISCRNVLIYLGPALQERVLTIFHYALRLGGILMLGSSETVGSFADLFEVVDKKNRFYVRTTAQSRLSFDYAPGTTPKTVHLREGVVERPRGMTDISREADRVILARYSPCGVVVDDNFHVIQFRGNTGPYLQPAPGPPTTELLLLAREGLLGDLRDLLDQARRDNTTVRKADVHVKTNDHYQEIMLEVMPITEPSSNARFFVVLFEPTRRGGEAEATAPAPRGPLTPEEESEKDREIRRLTHDLAATRVYLQSVIEQKESANEELRAANEEIICANEELQSTNEELTTAKEELQATNEELSTVNDELQNRIRLANQLSDDLVNLIESTRIPIIVLGNDMCIRRFTPSAQGVLNLRPGDVGRPLGELRAKINIPNLEELAREVIDTLEIKQLEVADNSGAWHKLYIRPYRSLDRKVGGAVLMLIDIDMLKRRELEIERARDYAVSIVETVREPLIVLDGKLRVQTANRAFYQSCRVTPAETEGRLIFDVGNGQWNIPELRSMLEQVLHQNSHIENFEVEHTFPGIGPRTMLLNAHRLVPSEVEGDQLILLAVEDITERKRAERLRQEAEDRLRTMVDTAVDAIITIDERATISSINSATERMFGYSAAELIGQNVKTLMPSPYREEHDGYLSSYVHTGEKHLIGIGREVQGRRKDGTIFPLDLAVSQYEDRDRRMFTGVLRDLTARKNLEREVLQVVAIEHRRIGQELHDTSAQELTALGLLADSLVATLQPRSPAEAGIAARMAEGVKRVLAQVRAFSRGLIGVEVESEGLMAALADLATQTTQQKGVTCTFEYRELVHLAHSQTATQLFNIAREAVTNALKHANASDIRISLGMEGQSVVLRVEDDGIGIAEPPPDSKGMGLKIMQYRAGLINGQLAVGLAGPVGTVVTCICNEEPRHDQDQDQVERPGSQGSHRR